MNSLIKTLAFCAMLGASGGANATEVLFPNGDFTAGGTSWGEASDGVNPITFSYPSSGGNPGGYASMDAANGQWGVLISNSNQPLPLGDLGLVAGNTYTFKYDMIASVAGSGKGGVKIESWNPVTNPAAPLSNSGDQRVTAATTGWAPYSYTYEINPAATHIKIVPLWTPNQTVGFDNIRVDNTPVGPPPVIPGIPNQGFEIPGGAGWSFASDGPSVSYPAAGGNPNGYAVMNQAPGVGNYGVLIANSDAALTIGPSGQLPLIAGTTATFAMDMRIEAGSVQGNIGGFKVDFVGGPGGSTGDMRPAKSGSGTEWATYTFSVPIPVGVTGVKLVPLWGPNSTVGYDNIRIVDTFAAAIANGFNVNWTADPDYSYQPQSSTTNAGPWVNIGSPIPGGAGNSIYQAVKAPFYQALEITPVVYDNVLSNPGFETLDNAFNTGAEGWASAAGVPPGNFVGVASSYGSVYPQSGVSMLVLDGIVPAVGSDVRSIATPVPAGSSYTLRFGLSIPVKSGGASLAYSLFYRDEFGTLIDPTGNKFTTIPTGGVGSAWTTVTQAITPPVGAFDVTVGFLLSVGADVGVHWVALFDNVSLDTGVVTSPSTSTPIAATTAPAVEISWPTATVPANTPSRVYQVRSSTDLVNWADFGGPVNGNGSTFSVTDALTPPRKFFQVSEVTP